MEIKWHGTASIEIRSREGRILFDPFVPMKGSSVPVKLEDFDGFSDILVTHGHFDHIINIPQIRKRNPDARIYCTKAPYDSLRRDGVPADNLIRIAPGESFSVQGFQIRTYQGKHADLGKAHGLLGPVARSGHKGNLPALLRGLLRYPENGETLFYEISCEGKHISLMGSLNYWEDVDYPVVSDLFILPYNGNSDNFVPARALIERLQPKKILLDHYDITFPPLTVPIDLTPMRQYFGDRVCIIAQNESVFL